MTQNVIVLCATGDQGSSVCEYLIEDGSHKITGITRNPESDPVKGAHSAYHFH